MKTNTPQKPGSDRQHSARPSRLLGRAGILTLGMVALCVVPAFAQPYTGLHSFANSDGSGPSPLIRDNAGNLYGTTQFGGANSCGTVFRLSPAGVLTTLHAFTYGNDGCQPQGGLMMDKAGNLFGAVPSGDAGGNGLIYELIRGAGDTWTLQVIYAFTGRLDGRYPISAPTMDSLGNLFGTAFLGGVGNQGSIFELTPNGTGAWSFHLLHDFIGGAEGAYPYASPALDAAGNLYGVTFYGSAFASVYKLSPNGAGGWSLTTLAHLGSYSQGTPVLDSAGNLYGTTIFGGANSLGSVFRLSPGGTVTTLYSFHATDACSIVAQGGLVFDPAGNLYGTASGCGSGNQGAVWRLAPDGTLTILHSFAGPDGATPFAGVILDAAGNLYGTAAGGGVFGGGVVFLFGTAPACAASPVIDSAVPSPASLWPPNGKMTPVTIAVSATDACYPSSALTYNIAAVTSNENTGAAQWQVTGPLTLNLQADRLGTGTGRIYTITVSVSDPGGKVTNRDVIVTVPHDQR